ncbi:MAG: DUF502 domain-containing protein [Rhizobiaceae bacterium]|nr:DUF502 domain-containing protein [Rhizobiaceae bacterium]
MAEAPRQLSGATRLRNYFLTGVVVTAPIAITAYLTWTFVHWVDSWVKPLIPSIYNPDNYLPFAVPGFGVIVALLMITLVGFMTANIIGRSVFGVGDRILNRTPLVRNVYSALKQIFETVIANRNDLFNRVGLFEYPRRGAWSIVFIAREQKSEIHDALDPREGKTIAVFRPITPNVTTGYLLYVPEKDVIPLDMTVEDAAKLLISAGLVGPEYEEKTAAALAEQALAKMAEGERAPTAANTDQPARKRRTASSRPKR